MENKNSNQQAQNTTNLIFIAPKSVRVQKDYLVIRLEDGRVIRKHVNYFKQILGIPYTPVAPKDELPSEEIVATAQTHVG